MQGRTGTSALIPANPFDYRTRADPYPVYQFMRTVDPIHRSRVGLWVLTRYEDCATVLKDPRWSHSADLILEPARKDLDPVDPTVRLVRAAITFTDPPRHAVHRRVLEHAVRPSLPGLERTTAEVAARLIRLMRKGKKDVDLIRDYALPLSLVVIGDLLGVPAADRVTVQRWSRALSSGLDPAIRALGVVKAGAAAAAIAEYMLERLDDARDGDGRPGVIGRLAASPRELRTWELIADLASLLVTGLETCSGLIGNALLALLQNPAQLKKLAARRAMPATALDELLRFDGPLHLTARVAPGDIEVGGKRIAAGEQAVLVLGAANRDPARFTEPDRLDLSRSDNPHLAFGAGVHACFAAPLARSVAASAIHALVAGIGPMAQDGDPEWNATATVRSLKRLPVALKK